MFPDNNWYGHRMILLKYFGIKDKKIFASLQHGWRSQFLRSPNYKKKKYSLLLWSKSNVGNLDKRNNNEHAIGAPFLYLCEILKIRSNNKKINVSTPKGTLVFPAHSSQDLKQETDHNLLIKNVEEKFEGPYTICFYYYDLNLKDINIYKKNKWRVVCCTRGRKDKYSLYRQYIEINKHNTIVCGEFNSALFYGMYLKKNTSVAIKSNKMINSYNEEEKNQLKSYMKIYPELCNSFLLADKGYDLAKKELGFDCMKNKEELKKLLGCNSIIKNYLSRLFSILYDLKYGFGLREGKDVSNNNLKKHITKAPYQTKDMMD
tara:strand:- start:98 stop:1051 length:954 start_codon:yes stop_codon:yes gene_type:complete